nr:xylanase [Thermobifida alba]
MTEARHRSPRRARRSLSLLLTSALAAAGLLVTASPAQAESTLRDLAAQNGGRHFGTALTYNPLNGDSQYRDIAAAQFSAVTHENEMKWEALEPQQGQYNWSQADSIINFAKANNQIVRGHTLVWHSQLPSWLNNGGYNGNQLRSIMENHIEVVAGRYRGDLYAWDVVNEAFNEDGTFRNSIWYQGMGRDYIAHAFRKAHEVDPNAKLYINDYNIEGINAKSNGLYNLVVDLLNEGVPIHGVGIQSHLIVGQVPSTFQQNMQRFADLGLDVAITELDIRMQMPADNYKLQQQARDYEAVVDACLAVNRCIGITVWGIDDERSWVPYTFPGEGAPLLYDGQYNRKPAWYAVYEALGGTDDPGEEPGGPGGPGEEPGEPGTPGGPCDVDYAVVNDWGNGMQGALTITNTGSSPISNWTLQFTLANVNISNGWNGDWTQNGSQITVTAPAWNATLNPGQSTELGFVADKTGSVSTPTQFTLNGATCS